MASYLTRRTSLAGVTLLVGLAGCTGANQPASPASPASPAGSAAPPGTPAPFEVLAGMPEYPSYENVYAAAGPGMLSEAVQGHRELVLLARIPVGSGPHGLAVWPQPGRYSLGHTGNIR